MNTIQLPGAFHVDGDLAYEGLFPSISHKQGLVLNRQMVGPNGVPETIPDGPHFCFCFFHPYLLTTLHSEEELRSNPRYRFQGPHIGGVFKSGGYLHGDSLVRRVTMIELLFTYSMQSINVKINGSTGPVIPGNGTSSKAHLTFDIWFDLPVSDILRVAPDCGEIGVKTLVEMLNRL